MYGLISGMWSASVSSAHCIQPGPITRLGSDGAALGDKAAVCGQQGSISCLHRGPAEAQGSACHERARFALEAQGAASQSFSACTDGGNLLPWGFGHASHKVVGRVLTLSSLVHRVLANMLMAQPWEICKIALKYM